MFLSALGKLSVGSSKDDIRSGVNRQTHLAGKKDHASMTARFGKLLGWMKNLTSGTYGCLIAYIPTLTTAGTWHGSQSQRFRNAHDVVARDLPMEG